MNCTRLAGMSGTMEGHLLVRRPFASRRETSESLYVLEAFVSDKDADYGPGSFQGRKSMLPEFLCVSRRLFARSD